MDSNYNGIGVVLYKYRYSRVAKNREIKIESQPLQIIDVMSTSKQDSKLGTRDREREKHLCTHVLCTYLRMYVYIYRNYVRR